MNTILAGITAGDAPCCREASVQPEHLLVDGNKVPQGLSMSCDAVVGGDALHPEISAASILAKVTRDREMVELDAKYPQYGFCQA